MPLNQVASNSGTFDLTSAVEVFTYTADQNRRVQATMHITNDVPITAGNWEITVNLNGYLWDGTPQIKPTLNPEQDIYFVTLPFIILNTEVLTIDLKSPSADTTIQVDTRLYDVQDDSLGIGARTVVITVDDGVNPIQDAYVRVSEGVQSYVGQTDVNGEITFNLDDAIWTVSITKGGYTFSGASLVVSADTAVTYSITQLTISSSTPGQTTGHLIVYDEDGVPEVGATVNCFVAEANDTILGAAYDDATRIETSVAGGLVEFTNLFEGVTYIFTRGVNPTKQYVITIPEGTGGTYELPSIIGAS